MSLEGNFKITMWRYLRAVETAPRSYWIDLPSTSADLQCMDLVAVSYWGLKVTLRSKSDGQGASTYADSAYPEVKLIFWKTFFPSTLIATNA